MPATTVIIVEEQALYETVPGGSEEVRLRPSLIRSLLVLASERKFDLRIEAGIPALSKPTSSDCNRFGDCTEQLRTILESQGIVLARSTGEKVEGYVVSSYNQLAEPGRPELLEVKKTGVESIFSTDTWEQVAAFILRSTDDTEVVRSTKETNIRCSLHPWGKGEVASSTGIGFFDHMLMQMGFYAKLRLHIQADGDLSVDEHHTVEDVALAVGSALDRALGAREGIRRYGFHAPMDESCCTCVLDLSGRPELVWNVNFRREMIGGMPTEMFKHFFKSFSYAARASIHISAYGENEHHVAESIFKACGQALRGALRFDPLSEVPSTKGVL